MNVLVLFYLIMEQHWMFQDCHILFWKFYIGQVTLSEREDCTGNARHQVFVTLCFFSFSLAFVSSHFDQIHQDADKNNSHFLTSP